MVRKFIYSKGELFLWDIQKEDDLLIGRSTVDDYFHRESISQINWVESKLVGSS